MVVPYNQDGLIKLDFSGDRYRYYADLNQWIGIGGMPDTQLSNYHQDGLVSPAVASLLSQVSELGIYNNFKFSVNPNAYYYLLKPHYLITVNVNGQNVGIELNRNALHNALLNRGKCPGLAGPDGGIGLDGVNGVPGPREQDVAYTFSGNTLQFSTPVPTPLDLPISIRIYKSNYINEILYNISNDHWEINSSAKHILVDQSRITYADGILSASIVIQETWDSGWTVRVRQKGPLGRTGEGGESFITVEDYNIYGQRLQQYISTMRTATGDLYYTIEQVRDIPVARLKPGQATDYMDYGDLEIDPKATTADAFAAVEPSIDSNKGLRRWKFRTELPATILNLPVWVPNPACLNVDYSWYNSTNDLKADFHQAEPLPQKCCQEDFFFCPSLIEPTCQTSSDSDDSGTNQNGCTGGDKFTVSALNNCICYCDETNAIKIPVEAGTYRITYCSGAVSHTTPVHVYNTEFPGQTHYCYGYNIMPPDGTSVRVSLGDTLIDAVHYRSPGVWAAMDNPFMSVAEAEAASKGKYLDIVAAEDTFLWLWYYDSACGNNTGSIVYQVLKIQ